MSNIRPLDNYNLTDWYQKPLGQTLNHIENTELQHLLPKYFGRYLLQLGGHELLPALQVNSIPYRFGITQESDLTAPQFTQASYTNLPIQSESVDAVILWHTLETVNNPIASLTEAWRTLTPDGHLIILGFNPLSLWGIKHLFSHKSPPWNGHFHNAQTICHWANTAGGEIILAKSFFFRPPIQHSQLLNKLSWLEATGLWLWPHMGGVYLLVIQKRTLPLTPVKLNWRLQTETDKDWAPTPGGFRHG